MTYFPADVAFIIPTRSRNKNVLNLIQFLENLDCQPGVVVIVASGDELAPNFYKESSLNITYIHTDIVGQVNQRNLGIQSVRDYQLIACLDDDIELESRSLSNLLSFWNTHPRKDKIAAVGFNLINFPGSHNFVGRRLILGLPQQPGIVLKSGIETSICSVKSTVKTQWVNGGATVWRKDLLIKFENNFALSGKAYGEDLFFSYPISQEYDFYIVHEAKATHNDLYLKRSKNLHSMFKSSYLEGFYTARSKFYFVHSNPELSEIRLVLFYIRSATLKLVSGFILFSPSLLGSSFGNFRCLLERLLHPLF